MVFYCGEDCSVTKDPNNPNRDKKTVLCRTAERQGKQTFKESILQVCQSRNDEWAIKVEVRVSGVVSDLHAANARYHDACRKTFL